MSKPGFYQGRHYTEWVDRVRQLKREGRHDAVEPLLLGLIAAAEAEARANRWPSPAPAYTEDLAIVYRKQKRYQDEVAILHRYMDFVGNQDIPGISDRARKAVRLAQTAAKAAEQIPACPSCGTLLATLPARSITCPHCGQRITVRTVDGRKLLMSDQQRDDERREALRDGALAEARAVGATAADFDREEALMRQQMGVAAPADVFWRVANQQAMGYSAAGDWTRAAQTYESMARHLHEEGRDPFELQKQAIVCYLRGEALRSPPSRMLVIRGCDCTPCTSGPRKTPLARAIDDPPIPHRDCERGWCRCHLMDDWEHGPVQYNVEISVPVAQSRATPHRGFLARLLGRAR